MAMLWRPTTRRSTGTPCPIRSGARFNVGGCGRPSFTQHVAVLGKTRSGKSSAMRLLVEYLLDKGKPVCIVDPKGDWWGIKLVGRRQEGRLSRSSSSAASTPTCRSTSTPARTSPSCSRPATGRA
jgi:hypothetical protein